MSSVNHSLDTYNLRSYYLKVFRTRLLFLMGGAGGLLFLADSELLLAWQKIVLIVWDFINIIVGYHALLGFEDAILNIEYLIIADQAKGFQKTQAKWPSNDEKRFMFIFYSTMLMTLAVVAALIFNIFFSKNNQESKSITTFKTSTIVYSIGPFVDGFDSLSSATYQLKIKELKDSFSTPRKYTEIDLFGGVDKRPLKGLSKKIFGDNITLAQSRAEWIKKEITKLGLVDNSCIIFTGTQGAKFYLMKYSDTDYANSRYVVIRCRYLDSTVVKI